MSLGRRLKELRELKKISRAEFAEKMKLSYWAISKYETDERTPDSETLGKIADFFDVSIDYLLGRTNTKEKPSDTDTIAAHRTDDPMDDLPAEARRSLEDFKRYILDKYRKK